MLGYLFAALSSIFFSLYVIPRKLTRANPVYFSLLMGTGFFASSVILYVLRNAAGLHEAPDPILLWAVLAGAIWATGFVAFVRAIDAIGLTRSNQWKNLQGPVGVLFALVILSEYGTTNPFFAVLAGLAIFASALALNISDSRQQARANLSGIYLAAGSSVAFASVAVINKHLSAHGHIYDQQVVWSAAIATSLLVYLFARRQLSGLRRLSSRDLVLGLLAGVIYLGASFFMLQSFALIPGAIAFTIIQLSALWTIILGVAVFHEVSLRKHYRRIALGLILALLGVFLLAFAR